MLEDRPVFGLSVVVTACMSAVRWRRELSWIETCLLQFSPNQVEGGFAGLADVAVSLCRARRLSCGEVERSGGQRHDKAYGESEHQLDQRDPALVAGADRTACGTIERTGHGTMVMLTQRTPGGAAAPIGQQLRCTLAFVFDIAHLAETAGV